MRCDVPERWDLEFDLVAVGSGAGGLGAAITAKDLGASAVVLEKSEQVGGVTAYSMGEVWVPGNHLAQALGIEDSPESGFRYVQQLGAGYTDDLLVANQAVHAPAALKYFEDAIGLKMTVIRGGPDYYYMHCNDAVPEGRLLEVEPFPGESLGEWQSKTRLSPFVPAGFTHHDLFAYGPDMRNWDFTLLAERLAKDERCLGPGLAAYFVKGAIDRNIPIHTDFSVEELVVDGGRVVGVRGTQNGRDIFVKANRGVVVGVSSYERDKDLVKTLSKQLDTHPMVMSSVDGAHLRLAGSLGARVASVPDGTNIGILTPGEEQEGDTPLMRSFIRYAGMPHNIIVNRDGKRFGNEAFYRSITFAVDIIDGGTQTHPNFPCWAIFDSQAREKYPFGGLMPGQEMPAAMGEQADSIEELGRKIGIDAEALAATVVRFNAHSEKGEDPDFNRGTSPYGAWMSGDPANKPNTNLGPLNKAPFYAVPLHRLSFGGIAAAGLVADRHCRVMGWDGHVIEGLYATGNSVARLDTGALMQSGMTNARGITHGYIAGRHIAGKPSDLLKKNFERFEVAA